MSRLKSVLPLALAITVAMAGMLSAATISHTLTRSGVYDNTTGLLISTVPAQIDAAMATGLPFIYRIDVKSILTGPFIAGESYGAEQLSLIPGAGLSRLLANLGQSRANYFASNPAIPPPVYSSSGTEIPGASFFMGPIGNKDAGLSTTDLLDIIVGVDNSNINQLFSDDFGTMPISPDPRSQIGLGAGTLIGQVWLRWDGVTQTALQLGGTVNTYNSIVPGAGSNYVYAQPPQPGGPTSLPFVPIPEPGTFVLMGLGALGLVVAARRRR